MLIAALFSLANMWNQPRCPTSNEWIMKMWCAYIVEYYSTIRMIKLHNLQENVKKWRSTW
jgi:hypothetical protein